MLNLITFLILSTACFSQNVPTGQKTSTPNGITQNGSSQADNSTTPEPTLEQATTFAVKYINSSAKQERRNPKGQVVYTVRYSAKKATDIKIFVHTHQTLGIKKPDIQVDSYDYAVCWSDLDPEKVNVLTEKAGLFKLVLHTTDGKKLIARRWVFSSNVPNLLDGLNPTERNSSIEIFFMDESIAKRVSNAVRFAIIKAGGKKSLPPPAEPF